MWDYSVRLKLSQHLLRDYATTAAYFTLEYLLSHAAEFSS